MKERLQAIEKTFIVSIVGLVFATMLTLAISLVAVDVIRYSEPVSAGRIDELTSSYSDVSAYLQSQKAAEPHFVTIANLVKQDQQKALTQTFLVVAAPIILASALVGYLIARRLLRPVEESLEAQDRFIQDAAHELRNPLAAIAATIEASKKRPSSTKAEHATLERIERQTTHLIRINEDLLYLQRAAEPFRGTTQVSRLTEKITNTYRAAAKDANITIDTKVDEQVRAAIRDRDYAMLLRNLVDNALKYSPAESTITIALQKIPATTIRLTVTDQGVGIPADEKSDITKRFYRASNSKGVAGSGLGLALVEKVVTSYKGSLTITDNPGGGTCFTVELPVLKPSKDSN